MRIFRNILKNTCKWTPAVLALALPTMAFAQEGTEAAVSATNPLDSGDTAFMLVATALVLLMTPGLAFFYAGMVRAKNVVSTITTSFIAMSALSVLWFVVGYSIAFAPGSSLFGGMDFAFFNGVGGEPSSYAGTIPHIVFALFQMTFAIITPALIAGTIVERMKFLPYLLFIMLWSLVVYSPIVHGTWGQGGLFGSWGFLDFAGGLPVHQIAGFSALAAALVLGKRKDLASADFSPNNVPLIAIGTGLLWFGWFGFNGGSALAANATAASAFSVTQLGAASAGLAWVLMEILRGGKATLSGLCIGMVVGLVAVTPGAGFISSGSAIIVGALGSAAANIMVGLRGKFGFDDSLDVFACHGIGGLVGTLLTGVFAIDNGGMGQFMIQLKSSAVGSLWAFVVTFVLLKALQMTIGLRASEQEENTGMDQTWHGENGYKH